MKKALPDILTLIALTIVGVLTRTVWHIAPNFEFITLFSVIGVVIFRNKKFALLLPILLMLVTDSIIGNTNIVLFTWSGFMVAPVISYFYNKDLTAVSKFIDKAKVDSLLVPSIVSVLFFYFWTNFGVVLTTTMYAKTIDGLVQSYINALPFLRMQLISAVTLGLVAYFVVVAIRMHKQHFRSLLVRSLLKLQISGVSRFDKTPSDYRKMAY